MRYRIELARTRGSRESRNRNSSCSRNRAKSSDRPLACSRCNVVEGALPPVKSSDRRRLGLLGDACVSCDRNLKNSSAR